jgi:NAD(P)H-flavin reductase
MYNYTNPVTLPQNSGALYQLKKDPENAKELIPFKLMKITENTHDSKIYTFEIPDNMIFGLNIGHHIALRYFSLTQRKYKN